MSNVLLFARNFHKATKQVIFINFKDTFGVWWGFHTACRLFKIKATPVQTGCTAFFPPPCKCNPLYIWIASMHFAETRTVCWCWWWQSSGRWDVGDQSTEHLFPRSRETQHYKKMTKMMTKRLMSVCQRTRGTQAFLFSCWDYVTAKCSRANKKMSAVSVKPTDFNCGSHTDCRPDAAMYASIVQTHCRMSVDAVQYISISLQILHISVIMDFTREHKHKQSLRFQTLWGWRFLFTCVSPPKVAHVCEWRKMWVLNLVPQVAIEMITCRQARERYDSVVMSGCCWVMYFRGLCHSSYRYSIYRCIISFICSTKMGGWLSNCTHVQIHVSDLFVCFIKLNQMNSSRWAEMMIWTHKSFLLVWLPVLIWWRDCRSKLWIPPRLHYGNRD